MSPTQTLQVLRISLSALAEVLLGRLRRGAARPGWSLRTEIAATLGRKTVASSERYGIPWLRAVQESARAVSAAEKRVRFSPVDAGGVAAQWCEPEPGAAENTLLYLHGGGYVIGSVRSHREVVADLALGVNARVLAVDYRLSPEHRFPAAQDDCLTAARWLLQQGVAPHRFALAGDSAGGALCVATLMALRDAGEPQPASAFLISPWTDPLAAGGSLDRHEPFDVLTRKLLTDWIEIHAPGAARDPRLSVLNAKLDSIAPLLIHAAGAEILLDQIREFAGRARTAGVDVEFVVFDDMFHDFHLLASLLPQARTAMDEASRWLQRKLDANDSTIETGARH